MNAREIAEMVVSNEDEYSLSVDMIESYIRDLVSEQLKEQRRN